jgi:hypothetical protein
VKPIVWSYGGGVQTIAILVLIQQGRLPMPELAIMADTVRERSSTWRYLQDHALPIMQRLGIRFEVASHELATVDLYAHNGDLLIPAFTTSGKLPTFCSDKWKKMVVRRRLRELGYGPDQPAVEWLGMSLDEIHRMKHSDVLWLETTWPLVFDVPLRRVECETVIERAGLPIPSKSACWMCPHMNDSEWAEVKAHDPDDFAQAVALDAAIREADTQGGVYLHKSLVPLAEAEFASQEELPLFECANSCWT